MFQVPEPTQGYRLPSGKFVATADEYVAEVTRDAAERIAGAYVHKNAHTFGRGQATKNFNSIVACLQWQAVLQYNGTLQAVLEDYDAFKASEKARKKAEVEAAQAQAPAAEPSQPTAPAPQIPQAPPPLAAVS